VHYAHWRFGPVVTDVARDLGPMLADAVANHARFLAAQRAGFDETFHQDPTTTAAQRGADAIAAFLRGEKWGQTHFLADHLGLAKGGQEIVTDPTCSPPSALPPPSRRPMP
jgi:hypothetical protein